MEKYQIDLAGKPLVFEIEKVAKQANGSVLIRYGDTVLLVTAVVAAEPREGVDFLPLLVDYEERLYSVGKIPGSFCGGREGRRRAPFWRHGPLTVQSARSSRRTSPVTSRWW